LQDYHNGISSYVCDPSSEEYGTYGDCDCTNFDNAAQQGTFVCTTVNDEYCFAPGYCGSYTLTGAIENDFESYQYCFQLITPAPTEICYGVDTTPGCTLSVAGVECTSCTLVDVFEHPIFNETLYGCYEFDCTNTDAGIAGNDCLGDYLLEAAISALDGAPDFRCDICGAGMEITLPEAVMTDLPGDSPPSCQAVRLAAESGLIPAFQCPSLQLSVQALCGCMMPSADPTSAPTLTPSLEPTPAPSSALSSNPTVPTAAPSSSPSFLPTVDPSCSNHPECSNLEGDCCATIDDVSLFCCGTTEPQCNAHGACVAEGLADNCCPTAEGVMLDCCDKPFAQCAVHPGCMHLEGDCCPTSSGTFLECCLDDQAAQAQTFETRSELATCGFSPGCANLDGDCCPTTDGVFLYCCESTATSCDVHSECNGMDGNPLDGECCPTTDGVYLACCERPFAEAEVHPECAADPAITGNACPNDEAEFEDCCLEDEFMFTRISKFEARSTQPTMPPSAGFMPRSFVVAAVLTVLFTLV
jgi:hypothetical protein